MLLVYNTSELTKKQTKSIHTQMNSNVSTHPWKSNVCLSGVCTSTCREVMARGTMDRIDRESIMFVRGVRLKRGICDLGCHDVIKIYSLESIF